MSCLVINRSICSERRLAACVVLGLVLTATSVGCTKNGVSDADVKAAQSEWTARLNRLRARQDDLTQQLHNMEARTAGDDSIQAKSMRQRAQSAVVSGQQGLVDIEREIGRLGAELRKAPSPDEALGEARIRMAATLAAQEDGFVTTQQALVVSEGRSEPTDVTATGGAR